MVESMMNKRCKPFLLLILLNVLIVPGSAVAQQSLRFDLYFPKPLVDKVYSDDFGNEMELTYQNNIIHIKSDLYLFGAIGIFYQPKSFERKFSYASDVAHYERYRYGASAGTGFCLEGPILNAELGIGVAWHFVRLNKTYNGMPPPTGSYTPAPQHRSRSYGTFNFAITLSHDITQSFFIRAAMNMQRPLDDAKTGKLLAPSLGIGYHF